MYGEAYVYNWVLKGGGLIGGKLSEPEGGEHEGTLGLHTTLEPTSPPLSTL